MSTNQMGGANMVLGTENNPANDKLDTETVNTDQVVGAAANHLKNNLINAPR